MDPVAALRPCAVDVELDGWTYTLPALTAARWIEAVTDNDGLAIVPGLFESAEDRRDVMARWVSGELDGEVIAEAARHSLEAASGRPWWEADRLIRGATHEDAWPTVHGQLVGLRGLDLERVSIGAFCNAVWALVREHATDESERSTFEINITTPPAGLGAEELYDEADAADAFMAAINEDRALHGGPPPPG